MPGVRGFSLLRGPKIRAGYHPGTINKHHKNNEHLTMDRGTQLNVTPSKKRPRDESDDESMVDVSDTARDTPVTDDSPRGHVAQTWRAMEDEPPAKKSRKDVSPAKYFEALEIDHSKNEMNTKYGCSLCGGMYKWKKSLNKHWKEKHTGNPGDNSSSPEGMAIILAKGSHFLHRTKRRTVIQQDVHDKHVRYGPLPASMQESSNNHAKTDDGKPSTVGLPGPFPCGSSSAEHKAEDSSPQKLMDNLNSPFISGQGLLGLRSTDETDGTVEDVNMGDGTREEEEEVEETKPASNTSPHDSSEERPASTASTSSCASSIEQGLLPPLGPKISAELERDLQTLDKLEADHGSPQDRPVMACPSCNKTQNNPDQYGTHVLEHLPPANDRRKLTKCAECRKHFPNWGTLTTHFADQHAQRLLDAKVAWLNRHEPEDDTALAEGDHRCTECDFIAKFPAELSKHIITHSTLRPWACVICAAAYKRRCDLTKHFKNKHSSLSNPYKSDKLAGSTSEGRTSPHSPHEGQLKTKGRDSCSSSSARCPTDLSHTSGLSSSAGHTSAHTTSRQTGNPRVNGVAMGEEDQKYYECKDEKCKFCCLNIEDLLEHAVTHKEKDKKFQCTICLDYKSQYRHDLKKHEERCKHTKRPETRSLTVTENGKILSVGGVGSRTPSMQQSTSGTPATNAPTLVARLYNHLQQLDAAERIQLKMQQQQRCVNGAAVQCSTLPMSALPLAPQAASPHKRFRCEKCNYAADRLRSLVQHSQVHKDSKASPLSRHSPTINGREVDEARLRHQRKSVKLSCNSCTFVCTKSTDFIKHQDETHGKNKCQWCPERWDTKGQYLAHISAHSEFNPDDSEWEEFFSSVDVNDGNNNNNKKNSNQKVGDHEKLQCQWCEKTYKNVVALFCHCRVNHFKLFIEVIVKESQRNAEETESWLPGNSMSHDISDRVHGNDVGMVEAANVQHASSSSDSEELHQEPAMLHHSPSQRMMQQQADFLSWIHCLNISTFRQIPMLPLKENDEVVYRCMFCPFSHHHPWDVMKHAKKENHVALKNYHCSVCKEFHSNEILEVMHHHKAEHPDMEPNITRLQFNELEASTPTSQATASPPSDMGSLYLTLPESLASTEEHDESQYVPLDLSSGRSSGTVCQPASSGTEKAAEAQQKLSPSFESATPPQSGKESSSKRRKTTTIKRSLFAACSPSKTDLKAQQVMANEANAGLRADSPDAPEEGLLVCRHCPFMCREGSQLRDHYRCHAQKKAK